MAQRVTSLGPTPSYVLFSLFIIVFFFAFLSLLLVEKETCFPLKQGIFVCFSVSPFVSL